MPNRNEAKGAGDGRQVGDIIATQARGVENEAETLRRIIAERGALIRGAYFLGGGNVYVEEFGRLCFCSGCTITEAGARDKKAHSSSCDELNAAVLRCLAPEAPGGFDSDEVLEGARRVELGECRTVRLWVPCPACEGSTSMAVTFARADEALAEYVGGDEECDCELTTSGWALVAEAAISEARARVLPPQLRAVCAVDGGEIAGDADATTGDCGRKLHAACFDAHAEGCDVCRKYAQARAERGRSPYVAFRPRAAQQAERR